MALIADVKLNNFETEKAFVKIANISFSTQKQKVIFEGNLQPEEVAPEPTFREVIIKTVIFSIWNCEEDYNNGKDPIIDFTDWREISASESEADHFSEYERAKSLPQFKNAYTRI